MTPGTLRQRALATAGRHRRLLRRATPGLVALSIAATWAPAHALGLGEPETMADFGQPLELAIPLRASAAESELLDVRLVSLTTPVDRIEDRATLERLFRARIVHDARGRPQIHLSSRARVVEPYVEFTVEVRAGDTRLQRSFTVLVDPPGLELPAAVEPSVMVAQAEPAAAAQVQTWPAARADAPVASQEPAAGVYQVQRGDHLLAIARRLAAESGIEAAVLARQLYAANPQAFAGSPDRLHAGARLQLPGAADFAIPRAAPAHKPAPAASTRLARRPAAPVADAAPPPAVAPAPEPSASLLAAVAPASGAPSAAPQAVAPALAAAAAPTASAATIPPPAAPVAPRPVATVGTAAATIPATPAAAAATAVPAAARVTSSTPAWMQPLPTAEAAPLDGAGPAPGELGTAVLFAAILSSALTALFMLGGYLLVARGPRRR